MAWSCTKGIDQCKCLGLLRTDPPCPFYRNEPDPGPSSPTKGPGPKLAAEETSQPAEGRDWKGAYTWLRGFIAAADPNWKTPVRDELQILADAAAGWPLDPRVTFSVDYGLADKLGNQLEDLRTDLAMLESASLQPEIRERFKGLKEKAAAAVKTCNELGLPW